LLINFSEQNSPQGAEKTLQSQFNGTAQAHKLNEEQGREERILTRGTSKRGSNDGESKKFWKGTLLVRNN